MPHTFSIRSNYTGGDEGYTKLYPGFARYKYNEVIKEIGFGCYQYKILAVIALLNTSLGVFMALMPFLIPLYKYDVNINQWEVGMLISSQGLGSLCGGVFFSYLSDISGRKYSLMLALVCCIFSSIVCTLFSTFWPFLGARLIAALGYGGIMPVGVTYLSEYLPDNSRGFYIIGMDIFRNLGGLLTIIIASYSDDNWRFFVLSPVPMFVFCFLVMWCFLPESSRYLLFKEKLDDLIETLNRMCAQNGQNIVIKYKGMDNADKNIANDPTKLSSPIKRKERSIWYKLFVKKSSTTVPLLMVWFFPAFGTGVFVFLPEILLLQGFDMPEIYAISAFTMMLPMAGVLICSMFIDAFGRKQLIAMCSLIAGVSLFTFCIIPSSNQKLITYYVVLGAFSLFMKILKSVTSAYTPECYKTEIRTTAMGIMSGIDRGAGILQPFVFAPLIYFSFKWTMVAFGSCYLLGFLSSLFLKHETVGRPLVDSFMSEITENENASALYISMVSER